VPFSLVALSSGQILEQLGITADGPILFSLLQNVIPPILSLIIIVAIMAASLSTGDGAILGTSSVMAHNIMGIRHDEAHGEHAAGHASGGDRLLLITRIMAGVITVMGVFFALRVPQTGSLLLLAFDLGFAGLVVPLTGGLFWPRSTWQGAMACIITGSLTRLAMFVMMPTMFGAENTLLYIPNPIFTADFDGFPTLISPIIGLIAFVVVSNLTYTPRAGSDRPTESMAPGLPR
jgi:Na+/proline symporter